MKWPGSDICRVILPPLYSRRPATHFALEASTGEKSLTETLRNGGGVHFAAVCLPEEALLLRNERAWRHAMAPSREIVPVAEMTVCRHFGNNPCRRRANAFLAQCRRPYIGARYILRAHGKAML